MCEVKLHDVVDYKHLVLFVIWVNEVTKDHSIEAVRLPVGVMWNRGMVAVVGC